MSAANFSTIIICIGNELIADDAAGFEIYNRLKEELETGQIDKTVRIEFCGVGGIDLLPLIEGESDLIVVDAVQLGAEPGTIHVISWDSLPRNSFGISAHGLGLRETIEIGNILSPEKMPQRITLVGVEGVCFNLTREYMTAKVEEAIDKAVIKIEEVVARGI